MTGETMRDYSRTLNQVLLKDCGPAKHRDYSGAIRMS